MQNQVEFLAIQKKKLDPEGDTWNSSQKIEVPRTKLCWLIFTGTWGIAPTFQSRDFWWGVCGWSGISETFFHYYLSINSKQEKKTFIALRLIDFMSSITKIIVFLKLSPKIMKASNYLYWFISPNQSKLHVIVLQVYSFNTYIYGKRLLFSPLYHQNVFISSHNWELWNEEEFWHSTWIDSVYT